MAPRFSIRVNWYGQNSDVFLNSILPKKENRMRELYLLSGLLISWYYFYNETPSDSSWIWDWYPDGTEWRQAVRNDGEHGLRKILLNYSGPTTASEIQAVLSRIPLASNLAAARAVNHA